MNATILAIRAITATYAQIILRPLLIAGIAVYAVVLAIIGWVAYAASPWWWLLAIVPTIIFLAAVVLWMVVFLLSKRLAPQMNKAQRSATKKFVGHLGKVAEHVGTPRFVLIFRVIKDVIMPPKSGQTFIGELAQTPGELRRDFDAVRRLFDA